MNSERLLKLAAFLDTLPPEKFDFNKIAFEADGGKPMLEALAAGSVKCGTVGCAIGWMPAVFPGEVEYTEGWVSSLSEGRLREITLCGETWIDSSFLAAAHFFGILLPEVEYLFMPGTENGLEETASAAEVAEHIRQFVRDNS